MQTVESFRITENLYEEKATYLLQANHKTFGMLYNMIGQH